MHDEPNKPPLDAGDAPLIPPCGEVDTDAFATWGGVDANGERSIRGVVYFSEMDRPDIQGEIVSYEALRNLRRQIASEENTGIPAEVTLRSMEDRQRLEASINRYVKAYFTHPVVPMETFNRSSRKPKNLAFRRMVLLQVILWLIVLVIIIMAINHGKGTP